MFLPVFLSFCLLVCLVAIGVLGYRSATASEFFDVKNVDVYGTQRSSKEDIERIVRTQTERSGTWNADLADLRQRVEQLPFVKSAAVSRELPNGLRVNVNEEIPAAVLKLSTGKFLVNGEGKVLAPAAGAEPGLPFAMTGWDENKTENAPKANVERVKIYQKMLEDWRQFDLASRVVAVDLSDLHEPRATVEDSDHLVSIALGSKDFAEYLKKGISAIAGKGDRFEAVDLVGSNMILAPRKAAATEEKTAKAAKNR